jgi:hypothetical protein
MLRTPSPASLRLLATRALPVPHPYCRCQVAPAAAQLPAQLYASRLRRTALADWLTRRLGAEANRASAAAAGQAQGWHGAKGGDVHVDVPGAPRCAAPWLLLLLLCVQARFFSAGRGLRLAACT